MYIATISNFFSGFPSLSAWTSNPSNIKDAIIIIATLAAIVPAINSLTTSRRTSKAVEKQAKISAASQIIEQLHNAINNLKSPSLGIRISTLIALRKVLEVHPEEASSIKSILEEFVRKRIIKEKSKSSKHNDITTGLELLLQAHSKSSEKSLNLSRLTIDGFDIHNIGLTNIDFSDSTLKNIHYNKTFFDHCVFNRTKIIDSNFKKFSISTDFEHSSIKNCNFDSVNIHCAKFIECRIVGTIFKNNSIHVSWFTKTALNNSDFSNSFFKFVHFEDCNLSYTNFSHTSMDDQDGLYFYRNTFKETNFYKARLKRARGLKKEDFENIINYKSYII